MRAVPRQARWAVTTGARVGGRYNATPLRTRPPEGAPMSESADTRFGAAEIAAMSSSEIAELWRWVDRQLEDGRSRWHWQVEDGAEGARLVPHGDHGDEHDPGPARGPGHSSWHRREGATSEPATPLAKSAGQRARWKACALWRAG